MDQFQTPPPQQQYAPPPRQGTGLGMSIFQSCLVAAGVTVFVPALIIGGFFLLLFALISSGGGEGSTGTLDEIIQQTVASPDVYKRVIKKGDAENAIALVTINGEIDGTGSPLRSDGALEFVAGQLKAAREDRTVKAVILQIDSPGGGLTASDQIHHEVERLKKEGKPVLAWAGSLMASGGYYIAAAADEIMANPTSAVGSIGVLLQHFQMRELLEKIGVAVDPVTSGEHKDIGSPFREMTEEERAVLQNFVNVSHARFVDIVSKGRDLPPEKVRTMATGDIYDAETAKELGLVDDIGYMEDAVDWAEEQAGERNMRIIAYGKITSLADILTTAGSSAMGSFFREISRSPAEPPKAMAIWDGGREQ